MRTDYTTVSMMRTFKWFSLLCIFLFIPTLLQAQWNQSNGPYGGYINALQRSGSTLYAGTGGSGVYVSTNNGTSWSAINNGLTNLDILSFTMCPNSNPSIINIYAGTNGGGVYLSTNYGTSWTQVINGLTNLFVRSLVECPNGSGGRNIYAGTYGGGIFLTTNYGTSWTAVNTGLTNLDVRSLAAYGTSIFAGTNNGGVFFTTNNGTSWAAVNNGLTSSYIQALVMLGSAAVYAGTSSGVFKSTDLGANWVGTGLTSVYIYSLAKDGTILYAGTSFNGVYTSADSGGTWTQINNGLINRYVLSIASISPNVFAGTPGAGVFLYNGTNWTAVNNSIKNADIRAFVGNGDIFTGTYGGGVFKSTDSGLNWTNSNTGLSSLFVTSLTQNGSILIAGTNNAGTFRSTNSGASWTQEVAGLTNANVYALTTHLGTIFAGAGASGGAFKTTNNGDLWTTTGLTGTMVNSFASIGLNLFAGTSSGVRVSTDNGTSWTTVNTGLTSTSVRALGTVGTNLFAGTSSGGVFLSTNNGTSWTAVNSGLTATSIMSLVVNEKNLFAGTTGNGVFLTGNNGKTWISVNTGLSNETVNSLFVQGTNLVAGTSTSGVWRRPLAEMFIPPPIISDFSPTAGPIGSSVTINGTNFGATIASNVVYFGPVKATVTNASATSLTVTVPVGATYDPITVMNLTTELIGYSSKQFDVTFPSVRSVNASSFAPEIEFNTGSGPNTLVIGDLDGDGKSDLAVTNFSSGTISILQNLSDRWNVSFATMTSITTGTNPHGLAVCDLDADGKLDLVAANYTSRTVSAFRNTSSTGTISFALKIDSSVGNGPRSLAVGDINGDGKQDVVVANNGSNTMSVLQNTSLVGSISFASKADFATANNPFGVAIGDLDGDGKPDIVVSNTGTTNSVSIFRNTSTIDVFSFAAMVTYSVGLIPNCVTLGDVDGDGLSDIAVTNYNGNNFSVLRNTSSLGSISFATRIDIPTGNSPYEIAFGDIDGNGSPDIAVANASSSNISVFRNTSSIGTVSFDTRVNYSANSGASGIGIGEIDGDGKPDIIVVNSASASLAILRNTIPPPTLTCEYSADVNTALLMHFNEVGGTYVADVSGWNNNGIATTGATVTSSGRFGYARNIPTAGNSVTISHSPSLNFGSSPFTIETWIKTSATTSVTILSKGLSSGYRLFLDAGGILRPYIDDGANFKSVSATVGIADGKWHHVAVIRDAANMYLYIDGVLNNQVSAMTVGNINTTGALTIGLNSFTGIIDELRLSNIARPPSEFNIPLRPTNLSVTPSGSSISLTWMYDGGAVPLRYRIYRGADSINVSIFDSTTSSLFLNSINVAADTRYYYRVSAVDSTGFEGLRSFSANTIIVTPPYTPQNLTATPGNGEVILQWNKIVENSFLRYRIYMSTAPNATIPKDSTARLIDTVKTIGGLINGTPYYFRLKAIDSSYYESAYSNEQVATPISGGGTLAAPSNLSAVITAGNVYLQWTDNSNNETGFKIERKNEQIGTYSEINRVADNRTYYLDSTVFAGTTYYYRVQAFNAIGYSGYSNEVSSNTDLTPPLIHNVTGSLPDVIVTSGATSPVTISAWVEDNESSIRSFDLQYISEGDLQPVTSPFSSPNNSSPQNKDIPADAFVSNGYARGVSYRLIATNNAGLGLVDSWITINVKNAPAVIVNAPNVLPAASSLPSEQIQKAYRIFSVPYGLENKKPSSFLPSSLGPHSFNGVNYFYWRFQRHLPGGDQDYEDFKDDQNAVSPGKGFFLIVRDSPKRISVGQNNSIVSAVRSDLVNFIGISLQGGWNLLGTPMNMNIPWSSLTFSGGNCTGRAYYGDNGSHSGWWIPTDTDPQRHCDTLRPWEGLAVRMDSAGIVRFNTLGPRVSTSDSKDPILAKQSELSANSENWVLRLNAYRSDIDMRCEGSGFGMAQNAKEGYDGFDMYIPPFVGDRNIALYFKNADGEMMQDIRPLNDEGGVWEMRVATGDAGARVKLQIGEKLNMPNPNFEAYLIDIEQKMAYNLKTISVLEISSNSQGVRDFRVVVGKRSYVEQQSFGVELTPSAMKLYSNYPNPFNPETVIRYTVSDRSPSYTVTLKIYNVLGQEIATLVNEQKPAGYYEVKWNASGQSSGIYFYEISIADGSQIFRDIKKMVLMK